MSARRGSAAGEVAKEVAEGLAAESGVGGLIEEPADFADGVRALGESNVAAQNETRISSRSPGAESNRGELIGQEGAEPVDGGAVPEFGGRGGGAHDRIGGAEAGAGSAGSRARRPCGRSARARRTRAAGSGDWLDAALEALREFLVHRGTDSNARFPNPSISRAGLPPLDAGILAPATATARLRARAP